MSRLPTVGRDNDAWGDVLNDYLQVSDGTQKAELLVCKRFLTQTSTNAPSFTSINDTILGTGARTATGTYTLTIKTEFFTTNKTVPVDDLYIDQSGNLFKINRINADTMTYSTCVCITDTTSLADGVLSNRFINIKVYN